MSRYVDFHQIDEKHRAIDARLSNWARWCVVHGSRFVQPMFRYYRPDNFDDERGGHDVQTPDPIDPVDALKIERAVVQLPENHKLATVWFYRIKCQPVRACRAIGVTRDGLAGLVRDSRSMLINRGA